jgi:hypothetical protein
MRAFTICLFVVIACGVVGAALASEGSALAAAGDSLARGSPEEGSPYRFPLTYWHGGVQPARFAYPSFMQTPLLEKDFGAVIGDTWVMAGSGRVFEARQRSFEDFSNIDIPIKFPQTIGRVIGQGANLNVTGSEQITFGGQTRYRVDEPLTEYGRRSKFPQLNMKQHLKIDLKGTVGEKINVLVHHDSDVETPLENRIKLRYDGDDDEIVQSVEMGNTNLSLPGSQFVGYSEQHQGLFGAKMLAKLGAFDITVVASKQEGRTAGASQVGTAARDSVRRYDLDFVRNKYFFMIDPYQVNPGNEVSEVAVYLDDRYATNDDADGAVEAYAFIDPGAPPPEAAWDSLAYRGKFNLLERNRDYAIDPQTGELSLLKPLDAAYALAVRYVYGSTRVGGTDGQGRLLLKMIRPPEQYMIEREAVWGSTLQYERKNVYSLGANYISEQKVIVRIYKKTGTGTDEDSQISSSGDKYEYTKILGVDLEDENNVRATAANGWATDRYADGGVINGELGLLLFPDLRPFDPNIALMGGRPDTLKERNPRIYDVHPRNLKTDQDSKYYIDILFLTPQTTFPLHNVNILENSETVTLNGVRLTRGVDYDIYYDVGQIRFKTDEAANPDARIVVDYQYVPFLALAQQSLFGVQGTYRFWDKSHISSAWIYQSKKSPEERPRLGQEPSKTMLGDLNARLEFEPGWMTALANGLPMVQADSPSRLSLAGEVAMSIPDPNTKGEVYIEDMEGVRDLRSFSLIREAWVPASPPANYDYRDNRKIWWYVKDREVKEQDLFPEAESRPGEAYIPVLEINFRNLQYQEASLDPARQWSGLMRLVSKTGADYGDLRFLDVWVRQKQGSGGKMVVDLGAVSENFYNPWNDSLHTEDKDTNGKLSDDENTGLDGVFDGHPGDDPYDDWAYKEGDYSKINGTERNPSLVPDTEDLDGNGSLDRDEILFRMGFDLDDTTYVVTRSGEWRHYRIPFVDADTLGGTPSWKSIRYIRFFFTDVDSPSVYQVAYLQVSGASWREEGIRKKDDMSTVEPLPRESFEISAKNTRDDPDYDPPYDPGKDPEGYKKREQSLVYSLRNLGPGNAGSIYKSLPTGAGSYTLYHSLAFYVHGDQRAESEDLYLFVRLGSDSVNFYEYGTKVEPGWRDVRVKLDEITNLKTQDADSTVIYGRTVAVRSKATEAGWMAVYGNPSITMVSRIGSGVVNLGTWPTSDQTIEVWFDDLRLTDVRRETGVAKRISVGASLSDVVNFTADLKQTDTEFQTISGIRKGSDDTDLSLAASTSVDRFLPPLGFAMPFSVIYHKMYSLPTLSSRSDVALTGDQRKSEETTSDDDSYSLGISRKQKSSNLLMRLTMDALSGRVAYSRRRSNTPEGADTTRTYTGSLAYGFRPWWNPSLRLYRGYAVGYFPSGVDVNISGSATTSKKIDKRQDIVKEDRSRRDIKGDFTISYKPLSGGQALETDYVLSMTRDLDQNKQVPILSSIGKGWELKRNQRASVTLRPSLARFLKPAMGYNVNYDENADPSVRSAEDPPGVRRVSVSSRSTVDLQLQPSMLASRSGGSDSGGVSVLSRVLALVPDVDIGYFLDRNSKYNKLRKRPGLRYQLGIDRIVDRDLIYVASAAAGQPTDEITIKNGFDLSSEFKPVGTVALTTKYSLDESERIYAGATTVSRQTIWPDVAGNISSSVYLPLFRGAVKSSAITAGYKGTHASSGEAGSETNRTHRSEWLPLVGWDATWSNGVRTTLNLRHSDATTENIKGNGSESNTTVTAATFSVRHSFSAPEGMYIPLAGRTLRFKSSLSVQMDFSYESQVVKINGKIDTSKRTILVTPKASYSFSKNVTGSADARFEQVTDRSAKQTWRTIGLNASVLIRF